jgi:hypothetical protein
LICETPDEVSAPEYFMFPGAKLRVEPALLEFAEHQMFAR